ncbi:MAG: hypothetical protein AAF747_04965 [Planctomycetota bacterium]
MIGALGKLLGRGRTGGPALSVAAFGKHPAWDDHMDDPGIDTEMLAEVKRRLYVEGVGRNIDAGAWSSMPAEERVSEFRHVFVWRKGEEIVLGRLWSSEDGKGRSAYPMAVCIGASKVPLRWLLEHAVGPLERAETKLRKATTQDGVHAELGELRSAVYERGSATGLAGSSDVLGGLLDRPAMQELLSRSEVAADKTKLYRLLYAVESELGAFRRSPESSGTWLRAASAKAQMVRVPRWADSPGEAIALWSAFFGERMAASAPIVILVSRKRKMIDVILGDAGPEQWWCLLADEPALSLTTDVPYELDDAFLSRARGEIAGAG